MSSPLLKAFIVILIIALSGLAYYKFYGQTTPLSPSKEIFFEKIAESIYGEQTNEKKNLVINSNEEWQKISDKPLDDIDFSKNTVIAVFAGTKGTGGYSIGVTKITDRGSNIVVTVKEVSPGANCILTQAITYPRQIIKTEKLNKEVSFERESETKDCQ